jgi:hypothetical protein
MGQQGLILILPAPKLQTLLTRLVGDATKHVGGIAIRGLGRRCAHGQGSHARKRAQRSAAALQGSGSSEGRDSGVKRVPERIREIAAAGILYAAFQHIVAARSAPAMLCKHGPSVRLIDGATRPPHDNGTHQLRGISVLSRCTHSHDRHTRRCGAACCRRDRARGERTLLQQSHGFYFCEMCTRLHLSGYALHRAGALYCGGRSRLVMPGFYQCYS